MWTHLAFILKPLKLSYVILCHCILVYYIDGLSSKKCSQAKSFSPSFIICTFHPKPHTSIWCSCHCGHALSGRIETIDSQNLILFQNDHSRSPRWTLPCACKNASAKIIQNCFTCHDPKAFCTYVLQLHCTAQTNKTSRKQENTRKLYWTITLTAKLPTQLLCTFN